MKSIVAIGCAFSVSSGAAMARADPSFGAPPPDASSAVAAPKDPAAAAPTIASPTRETTGTVSAGGLFATGNSQLIAASLNGKFDMRRDENGFGASLVGNYGETQGGDGQLHDATENLQGRLRYDRYLADRMSVFLIGTVRHDRFEGLDVRFNVDPGAKYLFLNSDATKLWGELGYDFQYDIRRDDARVQLDAMGNVITDPATGAPLLLDKTKADHSARAFIGFREAFNKDVTFSTGIEYLQSFVESTQYRVNYDALLAANVGAGFSFGVGFSLRYDHGHLPDKKDLDTSTTFSIIYTFSDAAPAPAPPPPAPCSCPPPPPPVVPATAAPAAAPETNTPPPAPATMPAPAPSPTTP
ncbi:MAG TPA: DUF481 domain-containing protein [Polyangiaceae bacterium]|jgi:putative salt-induced outer membrane protein YdiY